MRTRALHRVEWDCAFCAVRSGHECSSFRVRSSHVSTTHSCGLHFPSRPAASATRRGSPSSRRATSTTAGTSRPLPAMSSSMTMTVSPMTAGVEDSRSASRSIPAGTSSSVSSTRSSTARRAAPASTRTGAARSTRSGSSSDAKDCVSGRRARCSPISSAASAPSTTRSRAGGRRRRRRGQRHLQSRGGDRLADCSLGPARLRCPLPLGRQPGRPRQPQQLRRLAVHGGPADPVRAGAYGGAGTTASASATRHGARSATTTTAATTSAGAGDAQLRPFG